MIVDSGMHYIVSIEQFLFLYLKYIYCVKLGSSLVQRHFITLVVGY